MTAVEMNARLSKKIALTTAGLTAGLALLGGCVATPFDTVTDEASPVSARVDALVAANREYPRWENFPPEPVGLPTATQIAAEVSTLGVTQQALSAEVDAIEWDTEDPAALGAAIQSRVDQTLAAPIAVQTREDIEAEAERLRRRATPPPPIDRD
ncbi:hypothetical protein [Brevundimonas sp.]|uniref:hypothetical protein n=1 Tax=Brevundimonas sp. TaxID=1871086 RepID=UPI0035B0191E